MTTAFVLSGGGSLGAVQVGMLQALTEAGISPDLLVGTSAGAINAAWVAGHGISAESLDDLAEQWIQLRRHDIFPLNLPHLLRAVLGTTSAVCSADRLTEMVRDHAGMVDLDEAEISAHIVATDLLTGLAVLLSTGSVSTAVQASAAIPGIFPPVKIDGRYLVDGGVAGHCGIAQAAELGASQIYVLPAGAACALPRPPRTAAGVAMHALTLLIEQRLHTEVAAIGVRPDAPVVRVLPPLCPLTVSATDFSHAAELIRRGRNDSSRWLAAGADRLPHQERFLSLHDHRSPPAAATRTRAAG